MSQYFRRLFFFACLLVGSRQLYAQERISLAGEWSVRLDEKKVGEQQHWYKQSFERKIRLPGTLDDAGIGAATTLTDQKLDKDVLAHLTRKHSYIGWAWYARNIMIPESWKGKNSTLLLERVLWTSRVWIDGQEAGKRESLSTPHAYDLKATLTPGRHLLVICIDNERQYDMSILNMAHSYTEGTQIIWNGIIGKIQLIARNDWHIRSVQVYPSVKDKTVSVIAALQNEGAREEKGNLLVQVRDRNKKIVAHREMLLSLPSGESKKECSISVPGCKEWDEFTPALYTVSVQIIPQRVPRKDRVTAGGPVRGDRVSVTWGMREISSHNSRLWINGRRLFLRGTLECNIFPLTGHPPMDRKGWLKVFSTARAYGLNHLRFHSWCPPEAAFQVADSLGFYLQVELPFWNKNAGQEPALNRFLEEEAARISREYGNHPSFCLWSMGNELEGDFSWLAGMVRQLRQADPRHLYTSTTFSFQRGHGKWPEPGDDYYITQYTKKGWVRGQGIFNTIPPDFKSDYTRAVDSLPVPLIIHEMGQYSVYPNLKEIGKYTGVLDPLNFKAIRKDLARKDLLGLAPAFTLASGKFSAGLYKEEIERALRTEGVSGFELLDLHDFPGQGTALIGILDAFWDSKGLVTPEEHRMYCSAVVPLIRYEKAAYTNDESFRATVEVANFGKDVLKNSIPVWTAKDGSGHLIAGGTLPSQDIGIGNGHAVGAFFFGLGSIRKAESLTIELRLRGTPYRNKWRIWVYPRTLPASPATGLEFDTTLQQALRHLREGKRVLLNPDTADIKGVAGRFAPVFWSPVHFPDQPGTMGILCDRAHPALKYFPTDAHSDWQWWDLVTSSRTMILDSLPKLDPIIRVIDNFFKNRRMADVIEAKVGKGRLMLVSADITHDLEKRPAARQLRYSLEQYMHSDAFAPTVGLDPAQLEVLVVEHASSGSGLGAASKRSLAPDAGSSRNARASSNTRSSRDAGSSTNAGAPLLRQVDAGLRQAAAQTRLLIEHTRRDSFPETYDPRAGKYGMGKNTSWMSGFYPGSLLYLFEAMHDSALYREALRKLKELEPEQYNKDTHDLGFMMYCSFGNAAKINPDPAYKEVLLNSARSLASRYNAKVGCTRSWNSIPSQFMVIIDNMMNLELLCEATRISGDSSFYKIAVAHANTTMKNHFRPDYSSYHLVIYDPNTGEVEKKQTVQGAADGSAWARGQAWGLYGYTMMYRETKDRKYLEQAEHIAGFILPRLPADKIPYWDFDAPGIPNTSRDVSAASIMCSALLELAGYATPSEGKEYRSTAEAILRSLLSPAYASAPGENGGFLLKHGVGNFPKNSDIDVSIIYADYYFIESMLRYKQLVRGDTVLDRYRRYLYSTVHPQGIPQTIAAYNSVTQWPDIDYGDAQRANWQPLKHLERVRDIAVAWSDPLSGHFHDRALWPVMNEALDHWLTRRYRNANWWQNEIGVPQLMRDIIVLLRDTLNAAQLAGALQVMGQYRLQQSGVGANLVWSADLGLHFGLLTGNYSLVGECAGLLAKEIDITTGDGIQPDHSFHQHAARLQMYQYGAAFLQQNTRLAWQLKGTPWAFPAAKIKLLADFILQGWQWMCTGINTVPGTIDRSVSRVGALHSADMRELVPYLCALDPANEKDFLAIGARQNGQGNSLEGFRYYPGSDFSVYQTRHFGFFLKTLSDRTLPTESINSENLKGRLLNSGDAYVIKNGNEYYNLMPVWDWSKLPGITAFPSADKIIRHSFTGSVSDGNSGLTVMDYELQGSAGSAAHSSSTAPAAAGSSPAIPAVAARKYWACHDGLVVCLIAGLKNAGNPGERYTVLDQCRWQGDVTVDRPANVLHAGDHRMDSVRWIHHAGLAYIFLQPAAIALHMGANTGSWHSINASEPATPVTEKVFMPLWIHPSGPVSSGYVLAPCERPGQARALSERPSWKILRNSGNCQAVRFRDGVTLCAFYTKGSLALDSHRTVAVDNPCLVLVAGRRLSISDPSQRQGDLTVRLNKKSWHIQLPKDGTTTSLSF